MVAIVTGLSGVGKSWLLQRVMTEVPGQFLSASGLISEGHSMQGIEALNHDQLRDMDIEMNQKALTKGFQRSVDLDVPLVVLDAHVVIDTPKGLTFIPSDIFAEISPNLFIFVEDDPARIVRHRAEDNSRERPLRDAYSLFKQQTLAKEWASKIAAKLNVPFYTTPAGDATRLKKLLISPNGTHHG